ncbi:MAG: ATP-dependent DNA helicase RecG [Verrucomicrobiaceae bacterium]|nr:ATP-dependent DNA helicase RecG [Verrucomicrobiaceae bacterium]
MQTLLSEVPGLTTRIVKMLAKEGIEKISDVVWMLPFRHEDRRRVDAAAFQAGAAPCSHFVRVVKTHVRFFGRRRGAGVFEAVVEHVDGSGLGQQLTLRWWNMPFMSKSIATDMELVVYGRIKEFKGRLFMDHPEHEIIRGGDDDDAGKIHTGRITPVYRLRGALSQKAVRTAAWHVMEMLDDRFIADLLPVPSDKGGFAGWHRSRALHTVHFPAVIDELETARRYLALEEFYVCQIRVVRRRRSAIEAGGKAHAGDGSLSHAFLGALPFELTGAQRRALGEIRRDMAACAPMNRLLHGDVGSGKTVVALAAMLVAAESGSQAALMAPTQILAEQHFRTARQWLAPLGVRVELRLGGEGGEPVFPPPDILIGTHALLYNRAALQNLGLVVIDEQHKFGVAQRARLIEKGNTPDVLVMTATPIPRTLTLTLYGDLDVSTLDERPRERGKIVTKVRPRNKAAEAAAFLREQIAQGRQGYLVFPLIEESEKLDAAAAKKGHEEWTRLLEPHRVGLLHGRLSAEDKEEVMRGFRAGEISALVSTTVIEVGVDVPNATVMYVHDAGRFGLAQLHQLRGRIGRGSHTSYCVLFIDEADDEARQRLAIMEETDDGFRIAEEDLRRRGPGDVLGRAQSGQAPLRFAELLADTRLVRIARQLAERTLDEDPRLEAAAHAELRQLTAEADSPHSMRQ